MDITLNDLIQIGKLDDLRLIAGKGGLNNIVLGCSILDFQFDKTLNVSKAENFFKKNQLVMTSFLYAKDNEFLIIDALKKLTERGVSGLAVNNIYKLPINDIIIKIANSKNFPLFLFKSPNVGFENVILSIDNGIKWFNNFHGEKIIDEIVNDKDVEENVDKLYPNIKQLYVCVYFRLNASQNIKSFNDSLHYELTKLYFDNINYAQYKYKNGALLIFSFDIINSNDSICKIKKLFLSDNYEYNSGCIGISAVHGHISEMNTAIRECLYASAYAAYESKTIEAYDNLGIYKLIFHYCNSYEFTEYESHIIDNIKNQYPQNGDKLIDTLSELIKFKGSIHDMSKATEQHENTIRNRLEKIKSITALDFKKPDDYEQLSMAVKIHIAKKIINN